MRRRPDNDWLLIIVVGGAIGALAYIVVEVIPDAGLIRGSFQVFPRRKRIKELESAILENPSVGNYDQYNYARAAQASAADMTVDRGCAKSGGLVSREVPSTLGYSAKAE